MILVQLFVSFFRVGLFCFGGGYAAIPLIQNQVVDVYQLMTMEEFTNLITIAEMTPGPIAINAATFVGMRTAGAFGAVLCTLGCVLPSFFICLFLAYIFYKYRSLKSVKTVLAALRPAVVALIANAGITILILAVFYGGREAVSPENFHWIEARIFLGCLFLLRKFHIGAIRIILGSGIVGMLFYLMV